MALARRQIETAALLAADTPDPRRHNAGFRLEWLPRKEARARGPER
ncbi:hypothetical protein SAMN05216267_104338 [Actinacidiphila rubida]|uniref:Uncharacterized protein n=1 Tax=Actinacidiphila rubida TaxID=310780 RepID=A0A1H8SKL7_9ACTN|nr:hypothetical protein SAMN05216267_104338 [Actinacidiphila rubida]